MRGFGNEEGVPMNEHRIQAKVVAVLSCLLLALPAWAQEAPGGVTSGLSVWYDAGTGIPQNTTNVSANWTQRGGSAGESPLTRQGTVGSIDTVAGAFNFNPALRFNNLLNNGFGRFYGGPLTRSRDWITPSNAGSAFGVGSQSDQLAFLGRGGADACDGSSPTDAGRCNVGFRQDVASNAGTNFGGNASSTAYANGTNPGNRGPTANVYGLWSSVGTNQHRNTRNGWTSTGTGVAKQVHSDYQFRIGSFPGFTFDGLISEVIYYNRKISEAEAQRVTTYLGIKYGITLDGDAARNNTVNFDYLSASGTIVWAGNGTTAVNGYHRNVFGLARDSALDQRIATSINDSGRVGTFPLDILTMATGSLSAPSQFVAGHQSTGSALAQGQYLMVGNNNGSTTTVTATTVSGAAAAEHNGVWSRLARSWRVQNTGGVGTVSLLFNVPAAGVTALGGDLDDVVLLVDNDGNYTNGGTRIVSTGRSVSGNLVSFNVALANGEIFTLANGAATLTLVKTTVQAAGTYGFTLTGTAQTTGTTGAMAANATTTVDGNTAVAGTQPFRIAAPGTAITVVESALPANIRLTSLTCTNATSGATFSPTYDLPNRSVAIPAASVNAGAAITCTFTNTRGAILRLQKALPGGRAQATDQFTLTMTGTGAPAAVTTTGSGTTATGSVAHTTATPGSVYGLTETAAGSTSTVNYIASYACTNALAGGQTPSGSGTTFNVTTAAGDDLTCTFTNTLQQADVRVQKTATPNPVQSGGVVTYTIVVTNDGPVAANGTTLTDAPGAGLNCTAPSVTLVCTATGGATCPSGTVPISTLLGSGMTIPTLPVGGQVTATVQCTVTATGVP